jgi:hypothetical protein
MSIYLFIYFIYSAAVCVQEFSSMMVEVERDWEDRLEKVRENVRDHAEWRINALQQHYQARNKRRRQAEQDEEVSWGYNNKFNFSYRNIMLKVTVDHLAIKGLFSQQEYLIPLPRWACINLNGGL